MMLQRGSLVRGARAYSTYALPSMASIRSDQAKEESRIEEAEAAVAKLGFPQQGIYRHKVIWGEHDQFRHVNNVHYIRWLESARMEWVTTVGGALSAELREDIVRGRNTGIILATNFCRYRRPVTFPDTVLVGQAVELPLVRDDRFTLKTMVYSVEQNAVVADGEHLCVMYDYEKLRKTSMPSEFREALETWGFHGKK